MGTCSGCFTTQPDSKHICWYTHKARGMLLLQKRPEALCSTSCCASGGTPLLPLPASGCCACWAYDVSVLPHSVAACRHCRYQARPMPLCRSAPTAGGAAPRLEASALIELPGSSTADPATLMSQRQTLHLVVIRLQPPAGALEHAAAASSSASGAHESRRKIWAPGSAVVPRL